MDRRLAADLRQATSALRRALRHRWSDGHRDEPLAGSQSELLRVVEAAPGLTVAEAATKLHLAPNTVSTSVSELARRGLVERRADARDARRVQLWLTASGRARLLATADYREQVLTEALHRLDCPARETISAAIPVLRALIASIEASTVPESGPAAAERR